MAAAGRPFCALSLAFVAGCSSIVPAPVTVVTISPPALGVSDAPTPERVSKSRSPGLAHELDDAAPELAGAWRASTNTRFILEVAGGHASIVDAIDDNVGEHYPILRSRFSGGVLTWSFRIPSTGATMTYESAGLDGDSLRTHWQSDNGTGGDDALQRWPASDGDDGSP